MQNTLRLPKTANITQGLITAYRWRVNGKTLSVLFEITENLSSENSFVVKKSVIAKIFRSIMLELKK